jgi:hypothetical protein
MPSSDYAASQKRTLINAPTRTGKDLTSITNQHERLSRYAVSCILGCWGGEHDCTNRVLSRRVLAIGPGDNNCEHESVTGAGARARTTGLLLTPSRCLRVRRRAREVLRWHAQPVVRMRLAERGPLEASSEARGGPVNRRLVASPMISRLRTTANCVFLSLRNVASPSRVNSRMSSIASLMWMR